VEEYRISFPHKLTSLTISQDSQSYLVSVANGEVHLVDMESSETIRVFEGQIQGNFIIRSCFGGAAENFVLSGSEGVLLSSYICDDDTDVTADSKVYIWHKENGQLVETLAGHERDCVNAVAWNPRDAGMFASAGDDNRVRM